MTGGPARWFRSNTALLALAASIPAQALDFGPDGMFSINGFGEATATVGNNQCPPEGCQLSPETDRQRIWADAVVPGRKLSTEVTGFTQFQLWLGAKVDLGGGFRLKGTLSQNWRDFKQDTPGFVRERNVALSHEEYGTLTLGETVSRTWQFADFPFGSNLGLSSAWAGTGAGYRNLTRAVRYTSRVFDVADGDMVLEATYDRGSNNFKVHKPSFYELWAHYGKGDLSIDAMYQRTRNGTPSAFGAAVFSAPFYDPAADGRLGASGQSVALLQAIYQYSPTIELSGAIRRNQWSGAYAVVALDGPPVQFNFPFNVDWGGTDANGVANPGYEVFVVEPGTDRPLPADTPGEIVVDMKIPNIVMRAYYGMPEKTAEDFKNLKLHTGDLGRMDENGYIYFMDRVKDYIRRRGENVSSMEVERQVSEHPNVKEAAAIGVPGGASGEVVKLYVIRKDPNLTEADVIAHCRKLLTGYKVPKFVEFREDLPRSNVGKILRKELRREEDKQPA